MSAPCGWRPACAPKPHADRILWLEDGRFKEMERMENDPVCGMSIERDKAVATLDHGGRTYYFCSVGCRREFEEKTAAAEMRKL